MRILLNPEQSSSLTGPLSNVPRHPNSTVADQETALSILEKHADKISPMKVSILMFNCIVIDKIK